MKRIVFLSIIIIMTGKLNHAQDYFCQCNNNSHFEKNFEEMLSGRANMHRITGNNKEFFCNWTLGDVILANGETVTNKYLRYNGLMDFLLWMRESDYKTAVLDREIVAGFILYDENDEPLAYFKNIKIENRYSEDSTEKYLQVLCEGDISLYACRNIKKANDYGELVQNYFYYLYREGNYKKIKPGKARLLRFFHDDEITVRSIIRTNHLNVKTEEDLIKVIDLYNKMKKQERDQQK